MRGTLFKAFCLSLLLPLLGNCVGAAVIFPKKEATHVKPRIGKSVGTLIVGNTHPLMEQGSGTTCTQVIAQWGEPDHQSADGSETTLVYRDGLAWAGIMPIVLLPIPLILPVYPRSTRLICKDDVLVSAYRISTSMAAAGCGMLDEGGVRWGCDANGPF